MPLAFDDQVAALWPALAAEVGTAAHLAQVKHLAAAARRPMPSILYGSQLSRLLGRWRAVGARRGMPDYVALGAAIRGLLVDGRLPLGVRLPAERELAHCLSISRTTVTAAYRDLRDSGHLSSRRGAGSWTAMPERATIATSGVWTRAPLAGPIDDRYDPPGLLDLSVAAMAAPAELAGAAATALADLAAYTGDAGYHPAGLDRLRTAVASGFTARGLATQPDQIMITNGVQHALDLVLRVLVGGGQPVLVEAPTYPNALTALTARRARVLTHGLSPRGWDAELLLTSIRQDRPRLAYLIPEYQNPTGHLMPVELRERLPAAAHAAGTDLVVDESFVDLGLPDATTPGSADSADRPAPPAVASFDRHARVLTIGGMSKPYWGGLRIGWVRAAGPLVQRLAAARVGVDMAGPVLDQLVGARLLESAATVVPARLEALRTQRDTLVAALRERLPQWQVTVPLGGVSLWVELDSPISSALCLVAEDFGVRLAAGPRFGIDGTMERFLRLPYTLPPADLVEAVARIAAARLALERPSRQRLEAPVLVA